MKLLKSEDIIKNSSFFKNNPSAGVYFLLKDNEIVYVGTSDKDCTLRISIHKKDKDFDKYYILECKDKKKREFLESEYIFKFSPKYNRSISKNNTSIKMIGTIDFSYLKDLDNLNINFSLIGNRVYAKIEDKNNE